MAFRNFVLSGGAKEVSFLSQGPKEASYGGGSPFVSVNNNDVNVVAVEPLASAKPTKHAKPIDSEEAKQLMENVGDSDNPPSEGE